MTDRESPTPSNQVRLMVLSTPRATSTIFTKCLSRVADSEVFMEPYYWCYEAGGHLENMGKLEDAQAGSLPREDWQSVAEMCAGEDCSGESVELDLLSYPKMKRALENPNKEKELVICKNVAMGMEGHFDDLPSKSSNYRYLFLLRHPIKVFMSYRKLMYDYTVLLWTKEAGEPKSLKDFHFMKDSTKRYIMPGRLFKELYDLWTYVRGNLDPSPIIIDSDDLLSDPAGMLSKLCATLGVPYSSALLRWDAKPSSTDSWRIPFCPMRSFKVTSVAYQNALTSSEFKPPKGFPLFDDVSVDVRESYEIVKPYYDEMYSRRMKP